MVSAQLKERRSKKNERQQQRDARDILEWLVGNCLSMVMNSMCYARSLLEMSAIFIECVYPSQSSAFRLHMRSVRDCDNVGAS